MSLLKFVIMDQKEGSTSEIIYSPILLNLNHVVSVKPIRIQNRGELLQGHWVRLSNGKKYRAVEIPVELLALLNDNSELTPITKINLEDLGQDLLQ